MPLASNSARNGANASSNDGRAATCSSVRAANVWTSMPAAAALALSRVSVSDVMGMLSNMPKVYHETPALSEAVYKTSYEK